MGRIILIEPRNFIYYYTEGKYLPQSKMLLFILKNFWVVKWLLDLSIIHQKLGIFTIVYKLIKMLQFQKNGKTFLSIITISL